MRLPRIHEPLLHARRRTAAVQLIVERVLPGPVLMICYGNICRSPFAEVLFAQLLPESLATLFPVHSAGFIGPNRKSPEQAVAAANRVNIDLTSHRSKLITGEMLREASLVVVMSAEQEKGIRSRFSENAPPILVLGDLDPLPIKERTITDPWSCADTVFDQSYARIDRCIRELVRILETSPRVALLASQA